MFIYPRIRDLREDRDLKQKDIANMLNLQLTVYQRYERGEREPDCSTLIRLSRYFGVSIDYILCND